MSPCRRHLLLALMLLAGPAWPQPLPEAEWRAGVLAAVNQLRRAQVRPSNSHTSTGSPAATEPWSWPSTTSALASVSAAQDAGTLGAGQAHLPQARRRTLDDAALELGAARALADGRGAAHRSVASGGLRAGQHQQASRAKA
jgi:hypothetical protein